MTTRKKIRIPNYPAILLKPGFAYSEGETRRCFDALARHYKLDSTSRGFFDASINEAEMRERWASLALHLVREIVPAFRVAAKGGAPKQPHTQESPAHPHAHEARLVQIVSAFKSMLETKGIPDTNKTAYTELIQFLKHEPARDWKYGKIRATSSFVQAWKAIPKYVKAAPIEFLPPSRNRAEPAKDGGLKGAINWFAATEADRVWHALPPIPTRLYGSLT